MVFPKGKAMKPQRFLCLDLWVFLAAFNGPTVAGDMRIYSNMSLNIVKDGVSYDFIHLKYFFLGMEPIRVGC